MMERTGRNLSKGLILGSTLSLLLITACETMPTKSYSPAEEQMRDDASYVNTSYIEACAVGGGVGFVAALLTGNKNEAILAAGAGCAIAMGANYFLQAKRGQYVSEEEKMQVVLSTLRKENEKLAKLVKSSNAVIEEDKREIAKVKTAYRNRQISLDKANAQLQGVDENGAYLEQTLVKLEQREKEWVELSTTLRDEQSESNKTQMDKEITGLQNKIALLKSELQELEEVRDISTIG